MKRTITRMAAALALVASAAVSAQAQDFSYAIQFSFDGMFANPATYGSVSKVFGDAVNSTTLQFTGQAPLDLTAPTFADFGTVKVTAMSGSGFNFTGQSIYLQILQTVPSTGQASVVAGINGAITTDKNSQAIINWNGADTRFAHIGLATYELEQESQGFTSIKPLNAGTQTIRGYVTVSPEPASMTLLATGLIGIFGAARRRRNSATV